MKLSINQSLTAVSRLSFLMASLFLTACGHEVLQSTGADFSVTPAQLNLQTVWGNHPREFQFTIDNLARRQAAFTITPSDGLGAETTLDLAGGESHSVTLTLLSQEPGAFSGHIDIASNGVTQRIEVTADVQAVPDCVATTDCTQSAFDFELGRCVQQTSVDGEACGVGNHCLLQGRCEAGVCLGLPVACEDNNKCTSDSCDPVSGCVFTDSSASCAQPNDPCHAAFCDPVLGCQQTEVRDGTSCGPRDCSTASICMAGRCEVRSVPEGASCGESSPCQPAGVCRNSKCEQPTGAPLQPQWQVFGGPITGPGPTPTTGLLFDGQIDSQGTSYVIVGDRLSAIDSNGSTKWSYPSGNTGLGVQCQFDVGCANCTCAAQNQIARWLIDEAGGRLFVLHFPHLSAVSLQTGLPLWHVVDISDGLPAYDRGTGDEPERRFTSHQMTLMNGSVVVDVTEGHTRHVTHLLFFDRVTGGLSIDREVTGHVNTMMSQRELVLNVSMASCMNTRPNTISHATGHPDRVRRFSAAGLELTQPITLGSVKTFTADQVVEAIMPNLRILQPDHSITTFQFGTYIDLAMESWSDAQHTLLFTSLDYGCGDVEPAAEDLASPSADGEGFVGGPYFQVTTINNLGTRAPSVGATFFPAGSLTRGGLLSDGSALLVGYQYAPYDLLVPQTVVARHRADGTAEWTCSAEFTPEDVGLATGLMVVSDGTVLRGYRLPGIRPALGGWSTQDGNQSRDRVAR